MNKPDVKKLILLNLPYVFAFYFADKIAAVFRLAPGTAFIDKLTNGFAVFDTAFANPLPSFHGVNAYGIYVVDVVSGGPADKAGLKAGDRIVSIDNTEVAQKTDLGTLMQEHSAGDTLSITVARDGQMQTVSLTLGEKNAANSGNGTNGASRQEKSAESAPQQNPQG